MVSLPFLPSQRKIYLISPTIASAARRAFPATLLATLLRLQTAHVTPRRSRVRCTLGWARQPIALYHCPQSQPTSLNLESATAKRLLQAKTPTLPLRCASLQFRQGLASPKPDPSLAKSCARRNSFCLPSPPKPTSTFTQNSPQCLQTLPKPETPKAIATAEPLYQTFPSAGTPPPQSPPEVSPKPRPRETTFAHSPNLKTALAL